MEEKNGAKASMLHDQIQPVGELWALKDSGERRDFGTGSVRDKRDGKGRWDLLQFRAIGLVAKQLEAGAIKYGERNWELGQPMSVYFDSAMRHMANFAKGEKDERHDVAAAWNILCMLDTGERIREGKLPKHLDDMGYLDAEAE